MKLADGGGAGRAMWWRSGQWGGGGDVRIEEVHGDLPGGTEVGAVIKYKV